MNKIKYFIFLLGFVSFVACSNQQQPESQVIDGDENMNFNTLVVHEDKNFNTSNYADTIISLEDSIVKNFRFLKVKETEFSGFSVDGSQVIGLYDNAGRLIYMEIYQYKNGISGFSTTLDCYFNEKDDIYISSTRYEFTKYGTLSSSLKREIFLNSKGMYQISEDNNTFINNDDDEVSLLIEECINALLNVTDWGDTYNYGIITIPHSFSVAQIEVTYLREHTYSRSKVLSNRMMIRTGLCDIFVLLADGTSYSKCFDIGRLDRVISVEPVSLEFDIIDVGEELNFPLLEYANFVILSKDSLINYQKQGLSPSMIYNDEDVKEFSDFLFITTAVPADDESIAIIGYFDENRVKQKTVKYSLSKSPLYMRDFSGMLQTVYDASGELYVIHGRDLISVAGNDIVNLNNIYYAYGDGVPLISLGHKNIAVIDGNNYDLTGELEVDEAYLKVYLRKDSNYELMMKIDLKQSNSIAYLSMSPDEKKVYIVDFNKLLVYDIEKKAIIFNMCLDPNGSQPLWVGSNHLVFIKNGEYSLMHVANVNTGDSYSVNNLNELGLTEFEFQYVDKGYLYFSAKKEEKYGAYRVCVNKA